MSLVTLTLSDIELEFAIGVGTGHVAADVAWLPATVKAYDLAPKQTPPTLMPPVDTTGTGYEKLARAYGSSTLDGYLHQFTCTIDGAWGGATSRFIRALRDNLGYGGAVSVYGLDPYYTEGITSDGRVYGLCYWDGLMKAPKLTDISRGRAGFLLSLDFYRMTRRGS